jgi:pyruvate dehydrogenase (quinone)
MSTTVADQLIELLVAAGVTRIYGIAGDSLNALTDAVRRSGGSTAGGIDWIHVHNVVEAHEAVERHAVGKVLLQVTPAS